MPRYSDICLDLKAYDGNVYKALPYIKKELEREGLTPDEIRAIYMGIMHLPWLKFIAELRKWVKIIL